MSKHRTRSTWSRLLSGVLCLALVLGLMPAAGLVQTAEAAHWADPYAAQLVEWGVMKSASDLRLGDTITRAEFVAMCNRAFGYSKLGGTPFADVPRTAWYAQDIDIAYNAGYFKGGSGNQALPLGTLTREQAAVLIARNMMLQETVGEVLAFTDSQTFSDWSRGWIGAAAEEGLITGLPGGSFAPANNITRGEVAAMLVRAIGNPVSKAGTYELGDVYGNVMISSSNVTLRNTVILGNLYVTGGVDLGNVLLENVTVLGRIVIAGGGESHAGQTSVVLRNVKADELVIDSMIDQFTTVSVYGITDIPVTYVRSSVYLEDVSSAGYGLKYIEFDADPGSELQLAGTIKEVVNKTPFSTLRLAQGTAEKITIDEYAVNSELILDINTRVEELNLDVATLVHGRGDITNLVIGADGCEVEILPDKVTIRPGIVAVIDGDEVDNNGAAELSSEPRLMAGYPRVANLTPNTVEGQFSGNKQGTIYYAVSELADGSVSEEDLVNNPAYGGRIYKGQAGNIAAASKNIYSRSITQLEPDGSYYLTAMLEDGRGNRSPVKVVSFTTPDNTVPQLLNGYISRQTCSVVQLTGMASKSCTLYWVLLADGAAAPTPNNFKSGSFGGNYGSGSMNVRKNVPVSITVNTVRLQEDTNYVLYVWLNDFDGAQSSQVYKFNVHTPDETPPVVTSISQTDFGESDAQVTFSINEAPSTLYWAVVTLANESFVTPDTDLNSLYAQIKVESGATSIVHGSTAAAGAGVSTNILKSVLKGLDYKTYRTHSFKMYYVAKDAAGNYSEVGILELHTLDTDPPTAELDFNDFIGENPKRPRAGSDIKIVFSELVKGGASATQTFLDLYKQVESSKGNSTLLNDAKNKLASALSDHIKLYYIPDNGRPQQVSTTPSINGTGEWVDYRNAIVTLQSDGSMVVTLPGESRTENGVAMEKAISLKSGATYQFQIVGVFDDAYTPNGMAGDHGKDASGKDIADTNGNFVTGLYFTTVYAQVEMLTNGDDDMAQTAGGNIRLDMVFDVVPTSTENVADSEYWDLIMWCDTWVRFEIYRRVSGDSDDSTNGTWVKASNVINYSPTANGVSWNDGHTLNIPKPQQVTQGLKEKVTYTYGIHFTEVDGVSEGTNKSVDPGSWGNSITMWFSLVAGAKTPITNLSNDVSNYNSYVEGGDVSEIGIAYTRTGTQSILYLTKQFQDKSVPKFSSGYPEFDATANTITMDVMLDRPGTLYYVAAPAEPRVQIATTTGNGVSISPSNDTDTNAATKTYIPEGYEDMQGKEQFIWFKTGVATADGKANVYASPKSEYITGAKSRYPSSQYPDIRTADPVTVGSALVQITINELKPDTEYYVYIVLKGGGDPDEVVQIYRVTTEPASPPSVYITAATATTANIVTYESTGNTRVDSEVYWALVNWSNMPAFFNREFSWEGSGRSYTLKELLINRVSGTTAQSLFDRYGEIAKDSTGATAASFKNDIMTYIRNTNNNYGDQKPLDFNSSAANYRANGSAITTTDRNFPTGTNVECGVLAMAKVAGSTEDVENYGFAAIRGLFRSDPEPPVFKPQTTTSGTSTSVVSYVPAGVDLKAFYVNSGTQVSNWRSADVTQLMSYKFEGDISIEFTKPLYQYSYKDGNPVRREVVTRSGVDSDTQISFDKAVTMPSNVTLTVTGDGSLFNIHFEGIRMGQTITIFSTTSWITNSSPTGTLSDWQLTLAFDPTLTATQVEMGGYLPTDDMRWGGFKATWAKIR